jgi:hypothetical protein
MVVDPTPPPKNEVVAFFQSVACDEVATSPDEDCASTSVN